MSGSKARPARKPSGPALVRRLLRQGDMRVRYRHPKVLPMSAWPVLDAVARLVARSESALEYWPPEEIDLADSVADELDAAGRVDEVRGALQALARAGLVVLEDGGMRLPIVVDEARVGTFRPGRPLKGETPDAYRARTSARRREHEARQATAQLRAGQTNLLLPSVTRARADLAQDFRDEGGVTSPGIFATTSEPTMFGTSAELESPSPPVVVAVEDSNEFSSTTATATLGTRPARAGDLSVEKSAHKSGDKSAEKSDPAVAANVERLVAAAAGCSFDPPGTELLRGLCTGWLRAGVPASGLEAVVDKMVATHREGLALGGAGVRSPRWMTKAVDKLPKLSANHAAPLGAAPPPDATAAARDPDHPGVADNPVWRSLDPSMRTAISRTLRAMEVAHPGECRRRLDFCRRFTPEAYELVAAAHPEVWEMQDLDPPGAEPLRAAG